MPTLFIDADACPVTREAIDAARRANIPCVICGDAGHNLEKHVHAGDPREEVPGFWVRIIQVPQGRDAADFAIVCDLSEGDVVVTQDMGLASMALGRGAYALGVRGQRYDQRTIDALMMVRYAEQVERRKPRRDRGKIQGDKHPAFSADDRRRFTEALRDLLDSVV